MKDVKKSMARGTPADMAIRAALLSNGLTTRAFCEKYRIPYNTTSQAINGTYRPTEAMIAALVSELDGTTAGWKRLLWQAMNPSEPRPLAKSAGAK